MTKSPNPPSYTPLIEKLPATVPFVGPEAQERLMGKGFKARIGANENVFGPSPKALEAMREACGDVWMYADPEGHGLREALAARYGIGMENIVLGEGIDGLLGYLAQLVVGPGDKVVTSLGAYPTFNYHVARFGGELIQVPFRDDREDISALVERANESGAKLVYLSNPDNPMGTWTSGAEIMRAVDSLSGDALLVLDEAYVEFAPDEASPPIDVDDRRIVRMRTFSKAYGMAGARVGYAIGEKSLVLSFNKVRNHFGMGRVGIAGALAALADDDWLAKVREKVRRSIARIDKIARASGLATVPTAANFVAVDCGHDGDYAKGVLGRLVERGVFVRMPFVAPQSRCVRISAGLDHDLDLLERVLPEALSG